MPKNYFSSHLTRTKNTLENFFLLLTIKVDSIKYLILKEKKINKESKSKIFC